jgi:hypothetical protein
MQAGALSANIVKGDSMRTSTHLDEILWRQYRSQPPRLLPANLHAPRNYEELGASIDFDADERTFCKVRDPLRGALFCTHFSITSQKPSSMSVPRRSYHRRSRHSGLALPRDSATSLVYLCTNGRGNVDTFWSNHGTLTFSIASSTARSHNAFPNRIQNSAAETL